MPNKRGSIKRKRHSNSVPAPGAQDIKKRSSSDAISVGKHPIYASLKKNSKKKQSKSEYSKSVDEIESSAPIDKYKRDKIVDHADKSDLTVAVSNTASPLHSSISSEVFQSSGESGLSTKLFDMPTPDTWEMLLDMDLLPPMGSSTIDGLASSNSKGSLTKSFDESPTTSLERSPLESWEGISMQSLESWQSRHIEALPSESLEDDATPLSMDLSTQTAEEPQSELSNEPPTKYWNRFMNLPAQVQILNDSFEKLSLKERKSQRNDEQAMATNDAATQSEANLPKYDPTKRHSKMIEAGELIENLSMDFRVPEPTERRSFRAMRYKTELCRAYEDGYLCRYGRRCQFAHGFNELRYPPRHPKYKTELCRTFHLNGFCHYGRRCNFIHNEDARSLERIRSNQNAVDDFQRHYEFSNDYNNNISNCFNNTNANNNNNNNNDINTANNFMFHSPTSSSFTAMYYAESAALQHSHPSQQAVQQFPESLPLQWEPNQQQMQFQQQEAHHQQQHQFFIQEQRMLPQHDDQQQESVVNANVAYWSPTYESMYIYSTAYVVTSSTQVLGFYVPYSDHQQAWQTQQQQQPQPQQPQPQPQQQQQQPQTQQQYQSQQLLYNSYNDENSSHPCQAQRPLTLEMPTVMTPVYFYNASQVLWDHQSGYQYQYQLQTQTQLSQSSDMLPQQPQQQQQQPQTFVCNAISDAAEPMDVVAFPYLSNAHDNDHGDDDDESDSACREEHFNNVEDLEDSNGKPNMEQTISVEIV